MSEDKAVAWLREQVQARLEMAHTAAPAPGSESWYEDSGDYEYGIGIKDGGDDGCAVVSEAPYKVAHIIANDPQDVIARCEAELAILDEHYILTEDDRSERYEQFSVITSGMPGGAGDQGMGCVTCHYSSRGAVKGFGICRTVKAVASGYRHRPGYAGYWDKPA